MQSDERDEFSWFFLGIPAVCIPLFVAYLWLWAPSPAKPPINSTVFGCYSASNSPRMRLDGAGMHIQQPGFPIVPFHLEILKTGIALTADAPIRADRVGDTYRFGIDSRGEGLFLPFFREEGGHSYGVFDPSLLANFQMLATDGTQLNYRPVEQGDCKNS